MEPAVEALPHISIVIPTRNAPADVQRALTSFTKVRYRSWDVVVVDQSDDQSTRSVVEAFGNTLPQVRYRHSKAKGTSRARNIGIAETGGAIIGFLDHDCAVAPDYLVEAARVFTSYPRAGNVYGSVLRPGGLPEWSPDGWLPSTTADHEFEVGLQNTMRERLRLPHLPSMGGCMFVRRSVIEQVGLFDTHFGPGSRFPSCEDGDFTYRTVVAGYSVVCSPSIRVDHYGIREIKNGAAARHLRTYQHAMGGWHMKVLRAGDPAAIVWIVTETKLKMNYIDIVSAMRGGPTGLSNVAMFVRGMLQSFCLRVDRSRMLYEARSSTRLCQQVLYECRKMLARFHRSGHPQRLSF